MNIRARIFLAIFVTMAVGFWGLGNWIVKDLKPQFRETTEEPLVDAAWVLASMASVGVKDGTIDTAVFQEAFSSIAPGIPSARIYDFVKNSVDLRVYITDATGRVLFDSVGRDMGKDYSRWNDVLRTLRGEYGTRTSHEEGVSIMYVAAPVMVDNRIVGVLSVGKPTGNVSIFIEKSRRKVVWGAMIAFGVLVAVTLVISDSVTRPIARLIAYARLVGQGKRASLPSLGGGEVAALGKAFDEMRIALEGRQYVENYIQTLTHEMKSPLAAIHGAAELLREDMPLERRQRFLDNVENEAERMRQLIERLPLLSALENRQALQKVEDIDLPMLLKEIAVELMPLAMARGVEITIEGEVSCLIKGEVFLVRQAVVNLLQNALEFSPRDSLVSAAVSCTENTVRLTVVDQGPGIPEYALPQVFTRFYSLKRPDSGKKSTGLGLSLVREAMLLHRGSVSLENLPTGGSLATLIFPV